MLVLGLGLKAKFCDLGLGLAIGWPWPWDFGLSLRGLALAMPKSWQTTKYTINFHRLEHGDWSELYFKIHVPYLLTVGNRGLVRVLETTAFRYFYRNHLHYGMALAWDCDLGLDSVWPWPWSVDLGLECSDLVNIGLD